MKKSFVSALSVLAGTALGVGVVRKVFKRKEKDAQALSDKHLALFLMMNQWVRIKQEGKSLASYFETNNYRIIAIYGMSFAGETLVEELKDTDITIAYGIDKKADSIYSDVDIVSMEDNLEEVDAVVVTAITFFDEIEEQLSNKVDCPIISLADVLNEV